MVYILKGRGNENSIDDDLDVDGGDNELDEYSYHMSVPMPSTPVLDYDGRFICACGKTYKEERYMRYHKKWECGKLPTFQCPHCVYSAKRKNSLKQHLERRHLDFTTIAQS